MFKENIMQFIILTKNNEGSILRTSLKGQQALCVYHRVCAANTVVRFLHIKEISEVGAGMIINEMLKSAAWISAP